MQEKERIQKMLDEGKITKEEADELFKALKEGERPPEVFGSTVAPSGKQGTSGLALASMVVALCGFPLTLLYIGVILWPIAIFFGIFALREIKRNCGLDGRGMALAGIWLGVAGIIICVFMYLLYLL